MELKRTLFYIVLYLDFYSFIFLVHTSYLILVHYCKWITVFEFQSNIFNELLYFVLNIAVKMDGMNDSYQFITC